MQKEGDGLFRKLLEVEGKTLKASDLNKLQRYRKAEILIKSYLGNTLNLLGTL